MSSKIRRFYKRSRSSNMFDPQRLLYSSTRTQKKARVLHPKSISVSASAGLDHNQRDEIFNNIVSTRSYIYRPMSSNATTSWQSYQVYRQGQILCTGNPNESSLFNLNDCSLFRGPGALDNWDLPFDSLFKAFYPNSPFPFIVQQIKFRAVIPLVDEEGTPYFNEGTDLDFKLRFGIYSKHGTLVETIKEIPITYTVHNAQPPDPEEEEEEPEVQARELHIEMPFTTQVYQPTINTVVLNSFPTSFSQDNNYVKTQSTPFRIDVGTKPNYINYLNSIKDSLNTYKQFPATYHDQITIPLCTAGMGISTVNNLGFILTNETPEVEFQSIECRILLYFASFSGIPAPRS